MSQNEERFKTAGAQATDPRQGRHYGHGSNIVPELLVIEALVLGIRLLAEDPDAAAECVERVDGLAFSQDGVWRRDMLRALREMADTQSQNYVQVFHGYDEAIAHMPSLHVENAGGGENTSEANCGNVIGTYHTLRNAVDPLQPRASVSQANPLNLDPPVPLADDEHIAIEHRVTGVGQTSQVMVGCWHPAPERSLLMQAAARWALWRMQGHMNTKGVHEITWSDGSITPRGDLEPRLAYVPTLNVTLNWTFRATEVRKVPNRFSVTTSFTT